MWYKFISWHPQSALWNTKSEKSIKCSIVGKIAENHSYKFPCACWIARNDAKSLIEKILCLFVVFLATSTTASDN